MWHTVAGLKVSVVKLGRLCASHEESLNAGCSPEKGLGESSTEPEDRLFESAWLWGSRCPRSFEPLSLCYDKDKLHTPPLTQKHFEALVSDGEACFMVV